MSLTDCKKNTHTQTKKLTTKKLTRLGTPLKPVKCYDKIPSGSSYPNLAKSVHSFMMYLLSPFSISEYLGVKESTSGEICAKGAPNTKPMSSP